MNDNVSKIKDRLSVVDVISGYLKIQKAGANFKARCPFHNEKSPSFFISPERQIWHCFGCQKGGDIFAFVQEMEGVGFPEALRILAARAGVELGEFDSALKDSREQLYQVCETSTRFFEKQLGNSDIGKRAFEYLKERGLKSETMSEFRLGFAPNTWDSLGGYLRSSGFSEKEIVDAGVVLKRNDGNGIYDRFRSRIIFPIADANGRVVGFTGRIFAESSEALAKEEGQAKYVNTPQTLIYDKSRILYGLNLSRSEIRKKDRCLLVEGNMDVLMSCQAGVTNVVASSGTALTPTHLAILKRFTNNLDFCFDADSAGIGATTRGIGMALGQDFNVKAVAIDDKECKDPADYVKKYGQAWEKLVASAKPAGEFYFDKAKENHNPDSAESKKNVILAVAPFVKRLSSQVEKAHWISKLAFFLRVKEDAVENDIMSAPDTLGIYEGLTRESADFKKPVSGESGAGNRVSLAAKIEAPDVLNEALLSLVMKNPVLFKNDIGSLDPKFLNPLASQVIAELTKAEFEKFDFNDFAKRFNTDDSLSLEFAYLKAQALWDGFGDNDLKLEFSSIFNKLKQKTIHARMTDIGYELRAAESVRDKNKITDLAAKFNQLAQELAEIHNS